MSAATPISGGVTKSIKRQYRPQAPAPRRRLSTDHVARLVTAAAAGDELAWNGLIQEFGGMIWAVARAYRLPHADAANVSQETWVRLLEHLSRLKDPARVGAWLATTARRECLRALRENNRWILGGDGACESESPDISAEEALLLDERDETLRRSFARLRPSDQSLLRLLTVDPRPSYAQIAAALDMPIGSIGPTRARALERLRTELASEHLVERTRRWLPVERVGPPTSDRAAVSRPCTR